jgi:hypothetical protein
MQDSNLLLDEFRCQLRRRSFDHPGPASQQGRDVVDEAAECRAAVREVCVPPHSAAPFAAPLKSIHMKLGALTSRQARSATNIPIADAQPARERQRRKPPQLLTCHELDGAKVGRCPSAVEQPTKFEFVINHDARPQPAAARATTTLSPAVRLVRQCPSPPGSGVPDRCGA